MNKFELSTKPGRILLSFGIALITGAAVGFVAWSLIERFTNWTATRSMPVALGIGAVVAVGVALSTLFNMIKRIELDDQSLRIHLLAGGSKEYRLDQSRFAPKITHTTARGQHTGTTRALVVEGPHGTDTHTIHFAPEEFNELINRLGAQPFGRAPGTQGPGAPAATGTPSAPGAPMAPPAAAARQPLDFPPQRFEVSRKPMRVLNTVLIVIAAVMAALGLFLAFVVWAEDPNHSTSFILLGVFAVLALLIVLPVVIRRSQAAKLPNQVVVAPTWVSFDDRTFNYSDVKVIQIKPQGEFINRSAKILTKSDERVIYPLGVGTYRKMFEDYDRFAHLLERAGNASAGVVRVDWS